MYAHPRRIFLNIALELVAVFAMVAVAPSAHAETLVVTVQDIRNSDGEIHISLYNSTDNLLVEGQMAATQSRTARKGEIQFASANLQRGSYAAAAYHDENRSGEFDTDFIGLPREGYGFSNGAKAVFGPPDFEEASVPLKSFMASTRLQLTY